MIRLKIKFNYISKDARYGNLQRNSVQQASNTQNGCKPSIKRFLQEMHTTDQNQQPTYKQGEKKNSWPKITIVAHLLKNSNLLKWQKGLCKSESDPLRHN